MSARKQEETVGAVADEGKGPAVGPGDDAPAEQAMGPVNLNLYKIPDVALLTPAEELAQTRSLRDRLEERDRAVLASPFMWRQIVAWAELLERGEMSPKELMPRGRRTRAELAAMGRKVRAAARLIGRWKAEAAGAGLEAARGRMTAAAEGLNLDPRRISRVGRRIVELAAALGRTRSPERRRRLVAGLPVPPQELRRLGRRIQRIDDAIAGGKERLVEANMRLVLAIAKTRHHHGMELGDLIQEGALGLLAAAEKFDCRRGLRFSTYAYWWIVQGINRAIVDKACLIRLPAHLHERMGKVRQAVRGFEARHGRAPELKDISRDAGMPASQVKLVLSAPRAPVSLSTPIFHDEDEPLQGVVPDHAEPSVQDATDAVMRRVEVQRCLSRLDPKEASVLSRRFGLGAHEPATLDQLGRSFGVSRERIRQIEVQALAKLRQGMEHRALRDYA